MKEDTTKKVLMDGYVGVKFQAVRLSEAPPPEVADLYEAFSAACERLRRHNMTPANGGNISARHGDGMVISASGANLGCLEPEELIYVTECREDDEHVCYHGPIHPSSESIMHWLIYSERPEAGAIIHAHDEFATRPEVLEGRVIESEREEPYGSVALARMAIDAFQRAERIIVLKNHGYVAIGPDLAGALDLVVTTHKRLLDISGSGFNQSAAPP